MREGNLYPALTHPPALDASYVKGVFDSRSVELQTLWVQGKVVLEGEGVEGKRAFNTTVLYAAPDQFRLRAYRSLVSTFFEFINSGNQVAIFFNKARELFVGNQEQWQFVRRDVSGGFDYPELIDALCINRLIAQLIPQDANLYEVKRDLYLAFPHGRGGTVVARMSRKRLRCESVGYYGVDGKLRAIVEYESYMSVEGIPLPRKLSIAYPAEGLQVEVKIAKYRLNPEFSPLVFSLPEIRSVQVFPLVELSRRMRAQ